MCHDDRPFDSRSKRVFANTEISVWVWVADRVIRKRDIPCGTVGGRIAGIQYPARSKSLAS